MKRRRTDNSRTSKFHTAQGDVTVVPAPSSQRNIARFLRIRPIKTPLSPGADHQQGFLTELPDPCRYASRGTRSIFEKATRILTALQAVTLCFSGAICSAAAELGPTDTGLAVVSPQAAKIIEPAVTQTAAANSVADENIVSITLLGPEQKNIPNGYPVRVVPQKVIAELRIPQKFLKNAPPAGLDNEQVTNIAIEIFYPSMKAAVGIQSPEARINVIIFSNDERSPRDGARMLVSGDGVVREHEIDNNGLCGYVDNKHLGHTGDEFYVACDEAERNFSIICFPPIDGRRVCSDNTFLVDHLGAQFFYQIETLKDRAAMFAALRGVVTTFLQPNRKQ